MAEPSRNSGARAANPPSAIQNYFIHHSKTAKTILKKQLETPFATFFTCAVIGIALVLPALLSVLLINVQSINQDWDGSAQITLVLKQDISTLEGGVLSNTISKRPNIKNSQFIGKDSALASFKTRFEFADAIEFLDENPLPHVILIQPNDETNSLEQIIKLKDSLLKYPEVESAMLDVMWVQRLQSITQVLQRAVWIIVGMLALAVILVLGNTIRLAIENHKDEIIVMKLVGATNAFVRRPFLYMGMFLGLGGSVIAWILIQIVILFLNKPIRDLAQSYQSDFSLPALDFGSTLFLLILGMSLGWIGSWIAVHKHLEDIEPR